jgi:hypothetical protein
MAEAAEAKPRRPPVKETRPFEVSRVLPSQGPSPFVLTATLWVAMSVIEDAAAASPTGLRLGRGISGASVGSNDSSPANWRDDDAIHRAFRMSA